MTDPRLPTREPDQLLSDVAQAVPRRFEDRPREELAREARLAIEVASQSLTGGDPLDEIGDPGDWGRDEWLMNLPAQLVRAGLVEEGIEVCESLALSDSGGAATYAGDLALSLAEAGHGELARERVEGLLAAHPRDLDALRSAGYAYAALDQPEPAERHLRRLVEVAEADGDPSDVTDAYEHLLGFLDGRPDRRAAARDVRQDLAGWTCRTGWMMTTANPVLGPIRGGRRQAAEKVGRNQPCPCGSGLKYKRCHGR